MKLKPRAKSASAHGIHSPKTRSIPLFENVNDGIKSVKVSTAVTTARPSKRPSLSGYENLEGQNRFIRPHTSNHSLSPNTAITTMIRHVSMQSRRTKAEPLPYHSLKNAEKMALNQEEIS
jgi:hypothetical protein